VNYTKGADIMRRFLWTAIAALAITSGASAEIKFMKGLMAEALARADAEKKVVMVDFVTDWCRWCDTLDRNTYSDRAVGNYINGAAVAIKIDAEKGEGIAIAKSYNVHGYPSILFVTADGKEIDRIVGYFPPEEFLIAARDAIAGKNTIAALKARAEKNPSDAASQYEVASKLAQRNEVAGAMEYYRKVITLDPKDALGHNEEASYMLAVSAFQSDRKPEPLEKFLNAYPESRMVRSVLMNAMSASAEAGDGPGAKKYFERYTAKWPDDATAMNNYAWSCAEKGMNLEHAAAVAARAVELAPDNSERAMYLDTQATVAFARGDAATAIALEEKALGFLKDAPAKTRKDYEDSLAKFKAGKKP
jgi:thioredoxin-related protein